MFDRTFVFDSVVEGSCELDIALIFGLTFFETLSRFGASHGPCDLIGASDQTAEKKWRYPVSQTGASRHRTQLTCVQFNTTWWAC